MFVICFQIHLQGFKNQSKVAFFSKFALLCSSFIRGTELVPYLLVYKSTPHFQGQKSDFSSFQVKEVISYFGECIENTRN